MQQPHVVESSAVSAHRQVALVRWSLAAVGEREDRPPKPDPGDPLRRLGRIEPVYDVPFRNDW
jgi:hypothetical protein